MLTNIQTPYFVTRSSSWMTLSDVSINTWFLDQFRCFSINAWFLDHCFILSASLPLISRNHHHGSILDTLFAMLMFFLFNVLMLLLIIGIDSCKYYQIDMSLHMSIADISRTMLPAWEWHLNVGAWQSKTNQRLCHTVTVTFPTPVTRSCLANSTAMSSCPCRLFRYSYR